MKTNIISIARSFAASLFRAVFLGLTLAVLVCGSTAQAQSYFWTNTASGAWSVGGNWSNAPSAGGGTNTIINFNGTGTFASTNNLAGAFLLNQLNFGGPTVTLLGSNLTFTTGAAAPTISQGSGVDITIQNSITLSNTTTIGGAGAGGITFNGNIDGAGGLTKATSGTVTLTGSNTYSGITTINSGTLQIGSGGATGSLGTSNVNNISVLAFNRNNAMTVNNIITGSGSLIQQGSGSTILARTNAYTGGTWINSGTLVVGSANALGASSGAVNMNGGVLGAQGAQTVNNAFHLLANGTIDTSVGNIILGGMIDGDGALIATGGGTLTLRGTGNSYFGGTLITNATTVLVGQNYALGNGGVTMSGGTTLGFIGNWTIANAVQINGSSTFWVTNNYSGTESGDISGSGNLIKTGAGTLTLAGNNSYTGATTISNGTLVVGAPGFSGTLGTGNVTNWSSLIFNRSEPMTVANLITGTGSLTQNGSDVLTLTGSNNYSGITRILNGALQIGDGGATGTLGTSNVVDNGSLIFNRSNTMTVANNISGGGSLTQQGGGTTILAGNNTYAGGTWIYNGTLVVATNTALGSGAVTMNGGTLGAQGNRTLANVFHLDGNGLFNTSGGNLTINGAVDGAGGVYNFGGGVLTLNGANSYSGGTILNSNSIMQVGNDSALGSGLVTMYYGSTIVFTRNLLIQNDIFLMTDPTLSVTNGATVTESGIISGPGDLVKAGLGTLILLGNNTYTGSTTISNGVLQIGDGGFDGTLGTGAVTNWASLVFNRNGDPVIANNISGTGSLTQNGVGVLILTGSNDYSGQTRINIGAGALQVGNGGGTGTLGTGAVLNNSALIFNRSNTMTVANNISGSGFVQQDGSGRTILTGSNTYVGGTVINNGTLSVGSANALGIGTVTMNGGTLAAQGNRIVGNAFDMPVNGYFDTSTGNLTLNNSINGVGALINTGTGTLTLNHANGYSGGTSNNGGWLVVGNNTALGTGVLVMNGGTLSSGGGTLTITLGNDVYLAAVTNNVDTTGGHLILTGPITGNNDLWKYGANVLTLTGTNSYRDTAVQAGTLLITGNGIGAIGITSNRYAVVGYITNNAAAIVRGPGSSWNMYEMYVGYVGDGNSLTITNSGLVSDTNGYVGYGGHNNSALVNNATWVNNVNLFAGLDGNYNVLIVTNGATVTAMNAWVGYGYATKADHNSVQITGTNSAMILNGNLSVGDWGGYNRLTIDNRAVVTNANGYIGNHFDPYFPAGGTNTGIVNNATWINTGDLFVGLNGSPSNYLSVLNGGYLQNQNGYVGHSGDFNTALVTGTNSLWVNKGDLFVGYDPSSNNSLLISNGAVVTVATNTFIGFDAGSTNNSITVTDPGSLLSIGADLTVGETGAYNYVHILNGGVVSNINGRLGNAVGANNNSVLVTGAGSLWNNNGQVTIGQNGNFNQMTVAAGGRVNDIKGIVGYDGASNTVLVTGIGSLWNNSGDLVVGDHTTGNQMTITNGGKVAVGGQAYVGYQASAGNNSVFVTGSGSVWTNSNNLYVGLSGSANQMFITAGGVVYDVQGFVGDNAASANNRVLVSGSGSAWINSGTLTIGNYGATNSLTIQNGGLVSDQRGYVGYGANANSVVLNSGTWSNGVLLWIGFTGSYNTMTVSNHSLVFDGDGSIGGAFGTSNNAVLVDHSAWINTNNLYVGVNGAYNTLTIQNAGTVSDINSVIGMNSGGGHNSVLVTGPGSVWNNSGYLYIGYNNDSFNTLTINNGGLVSNTYGEVGIWANSNTATVDNATWVNTADLRVGDSGSTNAMIIQNTGAVYSVNGYIGNAGSNNSVLVTGNSKWINTGIVYVGVNGGAFNTLTITNGGLVSDQTGYIGYSGNNNSAVVSGSGSLWDNSASLYVGVSGSFNSLLVNNSGIVSNTYGYVGYFGSNNSAVVNGARWINSGDLYVGDYGDNNTLVVTNAGVVRSVTGYVGFSGTNNSALVSGAGSLWNNTSDLAVGENGWYNLLTINNGGVVSNWNGFVGKNSGNNNTAVVNNGTWVNNANLYIGYYGHTNALVVTSGGVVIDVNGYVGAVDANNNSALVTGAGSMWINNGDLFVGYDPSSNNSLVISNTAFVSATNIFVGFDAGSTNNSITVTDAGSLVGYGNLTVGETGSYNRLVIQNQGVASNVNGYIGAAALAHDNSALVNTGRWINSGDLFVGQQGYLNSLVISNNGYVQDVNGQVGYAANANNNSALVSGGTWNTLNTLTIGREGAFNTMTVNNGGKVYDVTGSVGGYYWDSVGTGANSNAVLVTGSGSEWINGQYLIVGASGAEFNTLTVSNGGFVQDWQGYVGVDANQNRALVTGIGSVWNNTSDLYVGLRGAFNTLTITDNGIVSNFDGYVGFQFGGNANTATVENATWVNNGNLTIGDPGNNNALIVQNAGVVRSVNGYIGNNGSYNSALITSGSLWNNSADLFVGLNGGSYNSLTVSAGGRVNNSNGFVGANANWNSALVTDAGSVWNNSGDLYIGSNGYENSLRILSGGLVSNVNGYVGFNDVSSGTSYNRALVDSATWVNTGNLTVGHNDDWNSLTIQNAGVVSSSNGYIGVNSGSDWNEALVTGSGSLWDNTADLFVGLNGGTRNYLKVLNGGRVNDVNGYIGDNADHNRAGVGFGSLWNNSGDLYLGLNGGYLNELTIWGGSQVNNVNGYIGANADDNWAWIWDSGSVWNNTGDLFVGFNGGSYNRLRVMGGTVLASNLIIGASSSYGNEALVDGGSLVVTNPAGGLVDIRYGSLYFNSGNILLNHLFVEPNGWYGDSGSGLLTLVNANPTIEIAGGKYITINSTIAGSEGMIKEGAGELILTAANTYTGATFINNGTLTVQNSYGVGFGNLNLINGTLRSGSEVIGMAGLGVLQVAGSYTQAVSGTLELGVGGPVNRDWLNIAGDASLDGTLRVFSVGSWVPAPFDDVVLIVASNGVTGVFSNFVNEIFASPMLITNLVYDTTNVPNNVRLTWDQLPFTPWAITPNQRAVAGALDSAITNPVMKAIFTRLDYPNYPEVPTLADLTNSLPRDFDLIAPDELSAMFTLAFAGMESHGYQLLNRINDLRAGSHGFSANRLSLYDSNGPGKSSQSVCQSTPQLQVPCNNLLSQSSDNPWGLFVDGVGEFISVGGDANASGYHMNGGGLTLGLDRRLNEHFVMGLTLGYASVEAGLVNDGKIEMDNFRAGLYAAWFSKGFHVEGMLTGGLNSYDTSRRGLDGMANGKTDGTEWSGLLGGGYDWERGNWIFGPQIQAQYKSVSIDGFTETGSLAPLNIRSHSEDSFSTQVGGHLAYRAKVGKKIVMMPHLNVAWRHEFMDDSVALDSSFANGAGNIFTVRGPVMGRDSVVVGAGLLVQWSSLVGTYIQYTTEVGRDAYTPHTINGGVNFRF